MQFICWSRSDKFVRRYYEQHYFPTVKLFSEVSLSLILQ